MHVYTESGKGALHFRGIGGGLPRPPARSQPRLVHTSHHGIFLGDFIRTPQLAVIRWERLPPQHEELQAPISRSLLPQDAVLNDDATLRDVDLFWGVENKTD